MASEAYKNKQDKLAKIRTSAYACTAQDIGKVFYCLNPNCTAHLFLRAFNSNKRESYFSTKKGDSLHGHIEGCEYAHTNNADLREYDTTDFKIEDFYKSILETSTEKDKHENTQNTLNRQFPNAQNDSISLDKIKTINQLYRICLSNPLDSYIGDIQILYLFCNVSTSYLYTTYISGYKLVVAKWYKYNKKSQTITLIYPFESTTKDFFIEMRFEDTNLFYKALKKLIKSTARVIILGNFTHYHDGDISINYTNISNLKQFIIVK